MSYFSTHSPRNRYRFKTNTSIEINSYINNDITLRTDRPQNQIPSSIYTHKSNSEKGVWRDIDVSAPHF